MKAKKKDTLIATIDAVQFEIFDTGIGINEENQANLFKLFGKVLQKNKQINKEGVGLGLYITKKLVDELGGIIEPESKEGFFTKFTITLPIQRHVTISLKHLRKLEEKGIQFDPKIIRRSDRTSNINNIALWSDVSTEDEKVVISLLDMEDIQMEVVQQKMNQEQHNDIDYHNFEK